MSKKTAAILKKARAMLVKDGWCQGASRRTTDRGVSHCAAGAIWDSTSSEDISADAIGAVCAVIDNAEIVGWNDAPGRTKREVLAAFTKAINAELKPKK